VKQKLLLVDDSRLARRSLRTIFEANEFEVIEAEDGLVALEQYFIQKPDVVMLDLVMNGMYGLEVLTKLLELDPKARVVVVSADVQRSSQEMVEAAGARGFVTKPVDREHLLRVVRQALRGSALT
jgi:two-component system, chemotaxis family, chemotaxis protein CheY